MRRNPFQQVGELIGLYAYLTAMGGTRYWPALFSPAVVEQRLREEPADEEDDERGAIFESTVPYEPDRVKEEAAA